MHASPLPLSHYFCCCFLIYVFWREFKATRLRKRGIGAEVVVVSLMLVISFYVLLIKARFESFWRLHSWFWQYVGMETYRLFSTAVEVVALLWQHMLTLIRCSEEEKMSARVRPRWWYPSVRSYFIAPASSLLYASLPSHHVFLFLFF